MFVPDRRFAHCKEETDPCSREDSLFDLALPLIERANASVSLDVGHLAWQDGNPLGFMAQHGKRVREVHLHDAVSCPAGERAQTRDHMALGRGQIDYPAFLHKLEETSYDGTVILELNSQADLEESLARVKAFL
jgi:sugar phosphate isomerase/epimerase